MKDKIIAIIYAIMSFITMILIVIGLNQITCVIFTKLNTPPESKQIYITQTQTKEKILDRELAINFFTQFVGSKYYTSLIYDTTIKNGLCPFKVFALNFKESSHNPRAVSYNVGTNSFDIGGFQLNSIQYKDKTFEELIDIVNNTNWGIEHLCKDLEATNNDYNMAFIRYNIGRNYNITDQAIDNLLKIQEREKFMIDKFVEFLNNKEL